MMMMAAVGEEGEGFFERFREALLGFHEGSDVVEE